MSQICKITGFVKSFKSLNILYHKQRLHRQKSMQKEFACVNQKVCT